MRIFDDSSDYISAYGSLKIRYTHLKTLHFMLWSANSCFTLPLRPEFYLCFGFHVQVKPDCAFSDIIILLLQKWQNFLSAVRGQNNK